MRGRYAITLAPETMRQTFMTYGELPNCPPIYNAAPTQTLPVVRQTSEGREIALLQWGHFLLLQGRQAVVFDD
jgi:putative SOS response-associated peptidase YedK